MVVKRAALAILGIGLAACSTAPKADPAGGSPILTLGKQVYEVHCTRCHGPDGKDESYPFIARLDGLGKRMTPEEILEATWESGFVSPRSMSEAERGALGLYVATL